MSVPRQPLLWALAITCVGVGPATTPTTPTTVPAIVPSTAPTTGPATAPAADLAVTGLIKQLDADDWQARDAAVAALVARGDAVRPAVADAAAHADSPEVRSRAAGVIAQLDQLRADRPTTVSLHVANANPRDVFAELGRQAGVRFAYLPDMLFQPQFGPAPKVTLDLTDRPFWSAVDEVCKQAGARATTFNQTGGADLTIMAGAGDPLLTGPVSDQGRLVMVAQTYDRARQISYADGTSSGSDTVTLLALIDPKLRLSEPSQPLATVTVATDDKGASLVTTPTAVAAAAGLVRRGRGRPVPMRMMNAAAFARSVGRGYTGAGPMRQLTVDLKPPSAGATKVAVLKGTVALSVVGRSETMTVDDAAHAGHVVRTVGRFVVDVDKVAVTDHGVSYTLSVRSTDGTPVPSPLPEVRLEDAAGHPIGGYTGSRSSDSDGTRTRLTAELNTTTPVTGPVRLLWTVATQTRTVTLPFEIHDLALPTP